jgi:hypothetical protein
MLDLLDCLMPACHEASAVTTPVVAGVTFAAVIALAVTGHRLVCRQSRDSCIACFKADLARRARG